jgi:hypothetical protein
MSTLVSMTRKALIQAALAGDVTAFNRALAIISNQFALPAAFRSIARAGDIASEIKRAFREHWIHDGDQLREAVGNDRGIMDAMRALLPPYTGPALVAYRGDSFFNRRRRTYGMSWSANIDVARLFAEGNWRTFEGGSVLLRAEAPPESIVLAVNPDDDPYGESEVIVDRRRLRGVEVVARFSQLTTEEYQAMCETVLERPARSLIAADIVPGLSPA